MNRPRPVVIVLSVNAGLAAILGFAGVADLIPVEFLGWLALIYAVWTAVTGVILQGMVTPLSSPQDAHGNRLVAAGNHTPGPLPR